MKKKLLGLYVRFMNPVKNERGAQSLEWLGLAALLILIIAIISKALDTQKESIGGIISKIIDKISKMVGD
ncbi:hypothetical protein AN964_18500 [Heyndrickxia shackletonii]|uniref:Uncharacterized protein n=1 Tax=Heyndrickxia shackletonii TaxID=157838 RepID=A0A0Q3WL56_9BACI|nr:hypothetical protein [Heyndrickxia shackletonii]KQL51018.1 hypothetical protein AN964_18500 [Heyndrickxia shackletonii]MBB2481859.1 hypothetical protein [Bacillus sp. APMAM]NEZ02028.1 hypothetical protein [Heyndrickxia shackletonii]RTZ54788.1 hypothetical protein EKO25_16160 [Bacillus sp. SAJ1]